MMNWSEALTKNRVDAFIFEDVAGATPDKLQRINELKVYYEGVFETPECHEKTVSFAKNKAKENPTSPLIRKIVDAIIEYLYEIKSDLTRASRRGRFVVNNWCKEVYDTVRKESRFNNFLIGHAYKEQLVVYNSVSSATDLVEAIHLIEKNEADVPLEFHVMLVSSKRLRDGA